MSALGEDENRPPHMVLAPDFLASSDTVVHPERGSESLCHNLPLKANPDRRLPAH
jgi:hypothetical protein